MKVKKERVAVLGFVLLLILFGCLVSAQKPYQTTIQPGNCVNITQTCADCTYVNFTSVTAQGRQLLSEVSATKDGTEFYHQFCNTTTISTYTVNGFGNPSGTKKVFVFDFGVTSSGEPVSDQSNTSFFIFIIIALYILNIISIFGIFWARNEGEEPFTVFTILTGMALLFLGVYLVNNGIITYRDNLTNYFSYITILWGAFSTFGGIYRLLEEL